MRVKRIAALLLSGVMMTAMLTGCGGVDKNATVATFDGESVALGVPNFAARLQQASYDDFYTAYFGKDVWKSDMSGNGVTMETNLKTDIINSMETMYVLDAHKDEYGVALTDEEKSTIKETASRFMEENSKDAVKALGASEEIIEEYLSLMTVQNKMYKAMIADADTNVSDEEANTGAYSYVTVSKTTYTDDEGKTAQYTEEEQKALAGKMEKFAAEASKESLETAAEAYDYTVEQGTFKKDDTSLNGAVLDALQSLKEGETSKVIDADTSYYVVRLDAKTDAEATEKNRQDIITQRQKDLYNEILTGWKEKHEWKVDEKVWAAVTFDNLFTTVEESDDTESVEPEETES